ncbi:MAG: TldD/PmbA family protein [Pseudobdellovibrionaceae bacterium]
MEKLHEYFLDIEKEAKKDGAEVELVSSQSESFSANYMKGALNKYSFDHSATVGVRVLFGRGAGFSTTEKISNEALKETYKEALQSAKDLDKEAPKEKSPQKLYRGSRQMPAMNLFNSEIEKVQISEKLKSAETLERAALSHDPRIQTVPWSNYSESKSARTLLNSSGLNLSVEAGGISAYVYALAKNGEDLKGGYSSGFYRGPKNFHAERMAQDAAKRSLGLLGAIQPKSGKYPIVFLNEVAGELISFLNYHLSAKNLDEGTSLLANKTGEKIFSEQITITDDPLRAELMGARPFDSEGAASLKTVTIENGILKSYLSNSYLAEKLAIPHTANASRLGGEMGVSPSNTVISAGNFSFEELLSSYQQVILITSVDALHTGFKENTLDFSLPAYGYLYENGEIVKSLHQMVVSGNLLNLLKEVEKVSRRYSFDGGSVLCPDVLFPEISIAGA